MEELLSLAELMRLKTLSELLENIKSINYPPQSQVADTCLAEREKELFFQERQTDDKHHHHIK